MLNIVEVWTFNAEYITALGNVEIGHLAKTEVTKPNSKPYANYKIISKIIAMNSSIPGDFVPK